MFVEQQKRGTLGGLLVFDSQEGTEGPGRDNVNVLPARDVEQVGVAGHDGGSARFLAQAKNLSSSASAVMGSGTSASAINVPCPMILASASLYSSLG